MRAGTIFEVQEFERAKKPAYKVKADFGIYGTRWSSAQITINYKPEELMGRQIIAVLNFPPKQIANFISECLILGVVNGAEVTLLAPDKQVENGLRIG